MSDIKFECPQCEKFIHADAAKAGQEANCPNCDCPVVVPYADIKSGTVIGGFKIKKKIGSGGMGEVWLAEQLSMDRFVALKILSPSLVNDPEFVDSFMHEIKIAAKLSHPNIITAHDAGEENGLYYLASTFVNGQELQTILANSHRIPELRALQIGRAIAKALQYAWDKYRIIHRDVKPGNIMIDRDENIKLMDMGISKSIFEHEALTTGTAAGTPNYMSPEQARDLSGMDFRSDIYSLGVTLFRCLAGRMPFIGKSSEELIKKHILEPAPPIKLFNKAVSEATGSLIAKMLEKDRFKRHKSWQDVIDDIDKIGFALQNKTRPVGLIKPRIPRLVIALAIVLVGLIITLALLNNKNRPPQDTPTPEAEPAKPIRVKPTRQPRRPNRKTQPQLQEPAKPKQVSEEPLEEDRLLAKIENQLKELKTQRQYIRINKEIASVNQLHDEDLITKESNKQKLTLIKRNLKQWRERALSRTFNNLKHLCEKLSADENFSEAATLMRQYRGDWAKETAQKRLAFASKYDELQSAFDRKAAIEKKYATHAMAVSLAENMTKGNFEEAEKIVTQMMNEESYFAFDLPEVKTICNQLKNVDKQIIDALTQKIGESVTLELNDGTRQRLVIESVGETTFSGTKTIGQASLTAKLFISQLSSAQRLKMLVKLSNESKALYQAHEEIAAGNIGKGRSYLTQIGTFSTFITNHLSARSSLSKIVDSILKKSETSEKLSTRLSNLKLDAEPAVTLFVKLLEFNQQFPNYQRNTIYRALFDCARQNFPLALFFSGKVNSFNLEDMSIDLSYDFSDPDQEFDFGVYEPVSMGQKIEIKENSLTIGCRRHGSLILKPSFTNFEVDFEGVFRLRDFNHIIASPDKNISYIGHGFGKIRSEGRDGIIRNWKLKESEEVKLNQSVLSPNIKSSGHLSWDGEIVNFSINRTEWPKQIFMVDEAQFAIAAFGTTNSYSRLSIKGQLSRDWLIKRISEIFYNE